MSYLTFKIISVAIMLVILLVALASRNSEKRAKDTCSYKPKDADGEATEIKHKEWYLSDFSTAEFFDDSKSSDPEKQRVGSHFWIESCRMSDGIHLSLYKNNWGAEADYMMHDSGFVESIKTVKGEDMQRLMPLCDNAENGSEVVEYLYKRFSPDGYSAYINILKWIEENGVKMSSFVNW